MPAASSDNPAATFSPRAFKLVATDTAQSQQELRATTRPFRAVSWGVLCCCHPCHHHPDRGLMQQPPAFLMTPAARCPHGSQHRLGGTDRLLLITTSHTTTSPHTELLHEEPPSPPHSWFQSSQPNLSQEEEERRQRQKRCWEASIHPQGSFSSLSLFGHSVETEILHGGATATTLRSHICRLPAARPSPGPTGKGHTWVVVPLLFSGSCNLEGERRRVRLTDHPVCLFSRDGAGDG